MTDQNKKDGKGTGEWTGRNSRMRRFMTLTARTDEDFRKLFDLAQEDAPGKLPKDKMAVAIFLGQFTNGSHMPEITNITEDDKSITIEFDDTARKAAKDGMTAGATVMSSPVLIRLLPKSDKEIKFKPADGLSPIGLLARRMRGFGPQGPKPKF